MSIGEKITKGLGGWPKGTGSVFQPAGNQAANDGWGTGGDNPPQGWCSAISCGHKWAYARSEQAGGGIFDVLFCEKCGQVKKV